MVIGIKYKLVLVGVILNFLLIGQTVVKINNDKIDSLSETQFEEVQTIGIKFPFNAEIKKDGFIRYQIDIYLENDTNILATYLHDRGYTKNNPLAFIDTSKFEQFYDKKLKPTTISRFFTYQQPLQLVIEDFKKINKSARLKLVIQSKFYRNEGLNEILLFTLCPPFVFYLK